MPGFLGPGLFQSVQSNMAENGSGGTTFTLPASNHTWSSWTQLISSTIEAQYVALGVFGVSVGGQNSASMVELGIGSSPSSSLLPEFVCGYTGPARTWGFPIHIPAGQELRGRVRGNLVSPEDIAIGVHLFGTPVGPNPPWVGSTITAYGTNLSASRGTDVTAGNGSKGSWTSLGTASAAHRVLVLAVSGSTDTTLGSQNFFFDIGLGSGPTMVIEDIFVWCENAEHISGPFMLNTPLIHLPVASGDAIQVRAATTTSTNLVLDCAVYGIG